RGDGAGTSGRGVRLRGQPRSRAVGGDGTPGPAARPRRVGAGAHAALRRRRPRAAAGTRRPGGREARVHARTHGRAHRSHLPRGARPSLPLASDMVARTPVSIVIPTRNEALQIGECVRGLAWAGEVIVVDGGLEPVADVGRLGAPLEHVPYRDLSHYLQKLDRYATWAAEDLAARGRRPRLSDLLFRPPARFARMYLLQLGVLEGWRGAVLCGLAAVSVFLKYARLWERSR